MVWLKSWLLADDLWVLAVSTSVGMAFPTPHNDIPVSALEGLFELPGMSVNIFRLTLFFKNIKHVFNLYIIANRCDGFANIPNSSLV